MNELGSALIGQLDDGDLDRLAELLSDRLAIDAGGQGFD